MFIALIVAIVIFMLIAQVARRKRLAKEAKRRASSGKKPVLRTYSHSSRYRPNLSSREQATFDHLAWFLKDPSKPDKLYSDDTLLLRIARQGIREGVVTEVETMRLLRRLGVDATPIQGRDRESTTVLPTGAEISISTPSMAMGTGEVLLSDEKSIQTRIDKGVSHFKPGDQVDVVCYANEGMFQFHTAVHSIDGKHLNLRHTPHVRHAQRRRYRRREMGMPVRISMPGIDHKPLSSSTVDLSIGGAALKNPRKKLALGAYVECAIEVGSAAPLTVNATVVRLSRRRKIAHVSFAQMDEKTRHRLFRRLIAAG